MIQINITKTNGTLEPYNHTKITESMVKAGANIETAKRIAEKIPNNIYDTITAEELRAIVNEELTIEGLDEVANNYIANNVLKVRTGKDRVESFSLTKISDSLTREAGLSQESAFTIAQLVWRELKQLSPKYLTTNMIREIINTKLLENGLEEYSNNYTRVGMPVKELDNLIGEGNKSNANMMHNPETIHKYVADASLKQYALNHLLPNHLSDAHLQGDLHIHDLEYFASRPLNCLQHDIRVFIRGGLRVDGTGDHTSVAKPPSHMETLMNHSGEVMLAAQQNMSGGQAMSLWNVFIAPFARGRSYEEIKQCIQMFIYNLNMAYAARGSQVPFTSMQLEFGVPKFLKDEIAYGAHGRVVGTYGDFEEEVRLINRAVTEVLLEGDGRGKMHLFPNTIYSLRPETFKGDYEEELKLVHDLSVKYGSSYFANMFPDYQGDHGNYMGCRTHLSNTWTGDWEQDCLRTGNLSYVTLNLPRMGYNATHDEDLIFEQLDAQMKLAEEIMLIRRDQAVKAFEDWKILPFLSQEVYDGTYYRLENGTLSFGFNGLNEMLQATVGAGIEDESANKFGQKVIGYINKHANQLKGETGFRWSTIQTPAESTAYRFAMLDKEKYGDKSIVNGTEDAYYYSNSSHVPVNTTIPITDKIKFEEPYHRLTPGGHIFHAFFGESYGDAESYMSLTEKICKHSDIGFWAYSSAFSYCMKCHTLMKGLNGKCPKCGETDDVEWYDRITGYVQQVGHAKSSNGGWNNGKKQELLDRTRYQKR